MEGTEPPWTAIPTRHPTRQRKAFLMARKRPTMPHNPTRVPQLTEPQRLALAAELDGKTTTEAAALAGVTRQTVSEWRNHNPEYRAARNGAAWNAMGDLKMRTQRMVESALDDIERDMSSDDPKVRRQARQDLMRYDRMLPDPPPADPDLEADAEMHRSLLNAIRTYEDGNTHA